MKIFSIFNTLFFVAFFSCNICAIDTISTDKKDDYSYRGINFFSIPHLLKPYDIIGPDGQFAVSDKHVKVLANSYIFEVVSAADGKNLDKCIKKWSGYFSIDDLKNVMSLFNNDVNKLKEYLNEYAKMDYLSFSNNRAANDEFFFLKRKKSFLRILRPLFEVFAYHKNTYLRENATACFYLGKTIEALGDGKGQRKALEWYSIALIIGVIAEIQYPINFHMEKLPTMQEIRKKNIDKSHSHIKNIELYFNLHRKLHNMESFSWINSLAKIVIDCFRFYRIDTSKWLSNEKAGINDWQMPHMKFGKFPSILYSISFTLHRSDECMKNNMLTLHKLGIFINSRLSESLETYLDCKKDLNSKDNKRIHNIFSTNIIWEHLYKLHDISRQENASIDDDMYIFNKEMKRRNDNMQMRVFLEYSRAENWEDMRKFLLQLIKIDRCLYLNLLIINHFLDFFSFSGKNPNDEEMKLIYKRISGVKIALDDGGDKLADIDTETFRRFYRSCRFLLPKLSNIPLLEYIKLTKWWHDRAIFYSVTGKRNNFILEENILLILELQIIEDYLFYLEEIEQIRNTYPALKTADLSGYKKIESMRTNEGLQFLNAKDFDELEEFRKDYEVEEKTNISDESVSSEDLSDAERSEIKSEDKKENFVKISQINDNIEEKFIIKKDKRIAKMPGEIRRSRIKNLISENEKKKIHITKKIFSLSNIRSDLQDSKNKNIKISAIEEQFLDFENDGKIGAYFMEVINDICFYGHDLKGKGKPEKIKNGKFFSRRIGKMRIVYSAQEDEITIEGLFREHDKYMEFING